MYLIMTKAIQIIDHKKKFELNYIFNSVIIYYLKFSTVKIALSDMQMQQKIVAIYLVLKLFTSIVRGIQLLELMNYKNDELKFKFSSDS